MFRERAGTESASSAPSVIDAKTTGFAITRSVMAPQNPLPPALFRKGMPSRFTPSPRTARTAGRNVSEPMVATNTTSIAPRASDTNIGCSVNVSPARETSTVIPAKKTARPVVLLAVVIASYFSLPASRSLRKRLTMKRE